MEDIILRYRTSLVGAFLVFLVPNFGIAQVWSQRADDTVSISTVQGDFFVICSPDLRLFMYGRPEQLSARIPSDAPEASSSGMFFFLNFADDSQAALLSEVEISVDITDGDFFRYSMQTFVEGETFESVLDQISSNPAAYLDLYMGQGREPQRIDVMLFGDPSQTAAAFEAIGC